ncbi:hypothetical protein RB653_005354 [Dictyostelium firmibasis]|uniref:Carbohydrate binding domain-containing protein n=1 Tax=Dictyostelium firmibasis TaxID=79012 RepID=A0AAN7UCG2_9MYCE
MFKTLISLTIIFALFSLVFCDTSLSISQIQTSGWEGHTGWDVTIMNNGDKTIMDATIVAESNFFVEKIWSMDLLSENKYHFPEFLIQNGLKNGTKHTFGYINKSGTPAIFNVLDVKY